MKRTCENDSIFSLGTMMPHVEGTCGVKFRHCTQSACELRYKIGRGHSDGSIPETPVRVMNAYADSHNFETPPDDGMMMTVNWCPTLLHKVYTQ